MLSFSISLNNLEKKKDLKNVKQCSKKNNFVFNITENLVQIENSNQPQNQLNTNVNIIITIGCKNSYFGSIKLLKKKLMV